LNNENKEVIRLWNIGNELGFTIKGDEKIIINVLKEMKESDRGAKTRKKRDRENI